MRDPSPCLTSEGSETQTTLALRLGGAGIILIVSAVASSFPSLVKRAPILGPPEIVFFIGKHFGTGVILSTAFIHLMQEAFERLGNPCLFGRWKDWTGALVLFSFLAIFLVEYTSTVYVERFSATHTEHRHSKVPSNNEHSALHYTTYRDGSESLPSIENPDVLDVPISSTDDLSINGNHGPYLSSLVHRPSHSSSISHHRHESPCSHQHEAESRVRPWNCLCSTHLPNTEGDEVVRPAYSHGHGPDFTHDVSRKTTIISIMVLQLGIMLHSIIIGLTLAVTDGANFTNLLTALVFHQLFEGLSLGIRISTLPSGSRATLILPVILCILFAITAPVGVMLGILFLPSPLKGVHSDIFLFHSTVPGGPMDSQTVLLTQGLMCALSAGMLIYAAGVEMLAGDFVMDPEMRQLGIGKQTLGLGSLILGTVAMWIVSIWA